MPKKEGKDQTDKIHLKGDMDAEASVGVMCGTAEGDQFGVYDSGARSGARAFYLESNPALRGKRTKDDTLVWAIPLPPGLIMFLK